MKRIMIIGCCGAGKSTFARRLHEKTGLELIHLDQHYWRPDWTETPKAEWEPKVAELAARDEWIIDGNYGSSLDVRLKRVDTVVYLDYPTTKCLWRVFKRVTKYHGKTRPDMPAGCNERYDLDFFHYVATFNLTRRKGILKGLAELREDQQVLRFTHDRQADAFLEKLA